MTRRTNARIAGFTFLFYIAVGLSSLVLSPGGDDIAGKLAAMAQHATKVRIGYLLGLLGSFSALVLAVTLHALTRDEDRDLALLGMACRTCEGVVGLSIPVSLSLLWLSTSTGVGAPDAGSSHALAAILMKLNGWQTITAATLFAVGSTVFSYLFLRGRMIPRALAWLGVLGSALLVIGLPLQLVGFFTGAATQLIWIPVALFEVVVAIWLIIRGAGELRDAN
jgi:uncharacterized protein DUF4386